MKPGIPTPEGSTVWVGFLGGKPRVCLRRANGRTSHCRLDPQVWWEAWRGNDPLFIDLLWECAELSHQMVELQLLAERWERSAEKTKHNTRWQRTAAVGGN